MRKMLVPVRIVSYQKGHCLFYVEARGAQSAESRSLWSVIAFSGKPWDPGPKPAFNFDFTFTFYSTVDA
jgi:hypothetical protein